MDQKSLSLFLSREKISRTVRRLGRDIERDYAGKCPLLLGVLNGSFIFLSDLVREAGIPLTVDFVKAQSYISTESTGRVSVGAGPFGELGGRHVLLVEDIVDTGITISHLMAKLLVEEPASLKLCSLLDKPSRRVVSVQIDYLGFTVPDKFIVGYGLDLDQQYRYLPDLCVLEDTGNGH